MSRFETTMSTPWTSLLILPFTLSLVLMAFSGDAFTTLSTSSPLSVLPTCPLPNQSFPCVCSKESLESPLQVVCKGGNLATLSLPLRVFFSHKASSSPLGVGDGTGTSDGARNRFQLVDRVTLTHCNISHLFGNLFQDIHSPTSLTVKECHVRSISSDMFYPLRSSLQTLNLSGNSLPSVPSSSLSPLVNMTFLDLSGNHIVSLNPDSFPVNLSLSTLDLGHNRLTKVHLKSLTPLSVTLTHLMMSHNGLSKLEKGTFRGFKKLSHLDLSNNHITSLDRGDFADLITLQHLNLSGNGLAKLPQSIFARSAQMQSIDVSWNNLVEVDAYMVRGVRFLRRFIAHNNMINAIARKSFATNTRIRHIDLRGNQLTSVPEDIFTGLSQLDYIDLSHNRIITLPIGSFQNMFQVHINLSHNEITSLPKYSFIEVMNMTHLDLSYNHLKSIHSEAFFESDITHLLLHHNQLVNSSLIPLQNITGLKTLDLSYNQITHINRRSFGFKSNVKLYETYHIDLSHNHIRELANSVFEKFWSLRSLDMSYNRLKRLGFGSFGNLPSILTLLLDDNDLKDISSGAIAGMISLKTLSVQNNRLESIPTVSITLNQIRLNNNSIGDITCSSFPAMNSLLELHLSHNHISHLNHDSFCNLLTLRSLDLSHNHISVTDSLPFSLPSLTSLQELNLSHNQLTMMNGTPSLGPMPILFSLNLSNNNITLIGPHTFSGLLQLITLNVSHNQVKTITPDSLKGLTSLQTLDLSYNLMTRMENRTNSFFEDLLSLNSLLLAGNRISFITNKSFPSSRWIPYQVTHVDLSGNMLGSIASSEGMDRITHLLLHHNQITSLHPGVIGNCSNLRHLDLSHNRLSTIGLYAFSPNVTQHHQVTIDRSMVTSHPVSSLEVIDVSHNSITQVDGGEMTRLHRLSHLDLSHNRLQDSWPEMDIVSLVQRGTYVNLTHNQFPCSCHVRAKLDSIRSFVGKVDPAINHFYTTLLSNLNNHHNLEGDVLNRIRHQESDRRSFSNPLSTEIESLKCQSPVNISSSSISSSSSSQDDHPDFTIATLNQDQLHCTAYVTSVQEMMMSGSGQDKRKLYSHSLVKGHHVSLLEGDIFLRGAHWLREKRTSLRVVWFVRNIRDDVANLKVERKRLHPGGDFSSVEVPYYDREYVFQSVDPTAHHQICLKTFNSAGDERPSFHGSCITSPPNPMV